MRSFIAAFGLIGFFSGVVLYLFLLWVVVQRKQRKRLENTLLLLLASLLVWYAGSFVSLLLRQMNLSKVATVLGIVDAVSMSGLALLPALLLHTFWLYYQRQHQPADWERKLLRFALAALYGPLLFLPAALPRLFPASGVNPIQRLGVYTVPFLVLLSVAYYGSCLVAIQVLRTSDNRIERALFRRLWPFFAVVPLFNFYVFLGGGSESGSVGQFLTIATFLSSLPPTLLVAYYIYRYRFLEIVVSRGIPTILLILATLSIYLLGIRRLAFYLQQELEAPPLLVEGVFLAAILLLFPPLGRWLERHIARLFSGELRKFRQLADRINRAAPNHLDPPLLAEFIEEILKRELGASQAKIHLGDANRPTEEPVLPLLASDSHPLGYLQVRLPEEEFSSAREEALRLVANEIAFSLERSQLLESKLRMERELSRKSQMEDLGRMAATVAHNVKNPLSSMKTLLQLFGEAPNLNADQRKETDMMIGEINRLSKTITGLLRFSRLEYPPLSLTEWGDVHLAGLVDSVREALRGDLQAKGLELEVDLEDAPASIRSDGEALTDILSNLLTNAIDASSPGGKIRITIAQEELELVIEVRDWGVGVPAKIRTSLFDPFVTTRARGTGLGLSIVRKRVVQLRGTIDFESPIGESGARFWMRLPVGAGSPGGARRPQHPLRNR